MAETILLSERKRRPALRGAGITLLFIAALVAGLAFFTPWDRVWSGALRLTLSRMDQVEAKWKGLDEASMFRFTLSDLMGMTPSVRFAADAVSASVSTTPLTATNVTIDLGHTTVRIDEARLEVGLAPLVRLTISTGPELTAELYEGKKLLVTGSAQAEKLLSGRHFSGVVDLLADCQWQDGWTRYPSTGNVDIYADQLQLPNGAMASKVRLDMDLRGERGIIRTLSAAGPLPMAAQGTVEFRKNLFFSRVALNGTIGSGEGRIPFARENRLTRLLN